MKHLFSPAGLIRLRALPPSRTLFAFDYDGTLAALTRDPADARMSPPVTRLLKELDSRANLAIVTGRARRDLHSVLNYRPQLTVGNHGLEGTGLSRGFLRGRVKIARAWKKQILERQGLRAKKKVAGRESLELEDKGYSITFHYRGSRDWEASKRSLTKLAKRLRPPPRIIHGKAVINLIPKGSPHKGDALRALMKRHSLTHALYVGDDETDEDVFRHATPRILGVRLNRKRGSAAPFYLDRRSEVTKLLRLVRGIVVHADRISDENFVAKAHRARR